MKKISNLLIVLILISLTHFVYADTKDDIHKVLLINSYDVENKWESHIREGLKETIENENDIIIQTEYLDIRKNSDKKYLDNFWELLNTKYESNEFDTIIAVDDEAFNMVRGELFNEKSIFYKKTILFTGVNETVSLTRDEKKYITGFVDGRSKIELIKLITELQPDVKNISVIIDNTSYSKNIKNKLLENKYLLDKDINLNFIQGQYESEILEELKNSNNSNEALLVCGIFRNENYQNIVSPKDLIDHIKATKDIEIYTSRQEYLNTGVIGGYVDIGKNCGEQLGKMLLKIYEEKDISKIPVIEKISANYTVDYKQIYKYDINPYNLPKETIVINKKSYQLLLPKDYRRGYLLAVVIVILVILHIILKMIKYKRNEIKNRKLYEIAQYREQLKTDFIVNMSHELRTPLNIITSSATLLGVKANKEHAVNSKYILNKVEGINQNSNRLRRLINNLIDISKFDSGFFECKCKNENIVYVVEDIVGEVVDYAYAKNIELIFDTEEEEIITFIDKEQIERVILNILSNAIKFTRDNGRIEVYIKRDYKFVYISIKDNGIGIDQEKLQQIFHRFYQVDHILSRENEGSGIGLCIVDEIIKMHGGKVNIESEVDKGTTFEIVLSVSEERFVDYKDKKSDRNIKDVVKVEMADI